MLTILGKFGKASRIVTALALIGAIGAATVASDAHARTTTCWRCTGGWCCY